MMPTVMSLALASAATVSAVKMGFAYGSTWTGTPMVQSDYVSAFKVAQNLVGASGFTSARLYTMIQYGTVNSSSQAIPAAIATKTSLLLGLWVSGGGFKNELIALNSAIATYGNSLGSLIDGISVGSQDLYRYSTTGAGLGVDPSTMASYIKQVKSAIASTALSNAPVGHVDHWDAWVNSSNMAVIDACDWIGMNAFPMYESITSVADAKSVFFSELSNVQSAAKGIPVWVTETGWPASGNSSFPAKPSLANAKTYWEQVGCSLFGSTNVWWYGLIDASGLTANPSFSIVGNKLTNIPLFDLSCPDVSSSSAGSATSSTQSRFMTTTSRSGAEIPASTTSSTNGTPPTSLPSASGLSGGAIAGIVIAVVAAFLIGALATFFFLKRAGKKVGAGDTAPNDMPELGGQAVSELHGDGKSRSFPGTESRGWAISEMDTNDPRAQQNAEHAGVIRNIYELPDMSSWSNSGTANESHLRG